MANNLFGTYEYPDFPMESEVFGVKKNEHISGPVLNAYHKAYAAKFGITPLVRFNTKVLVAEHMETDEGGWELTTLNSETKVEAKLYTRRLIVATGQTSEAFIPHFEGQETFGGPIFHGKDWPLYADTVKKETTITVFGGSKFAWDAVYQYASVGAKVNWVIRCELTTAIHVSCALLSLTTATYSIWSWSLLDLFSMGDTVKEVDRAACQYVSAPDLL